jgi:large subunit ribosomal protein L6
MRTLLSNMITGVTQGFSKKLEINGVGYRAQLQGASIKLNLGFSHDVVFPLPQGVTAVIEQNTITVSGIDKQQVGQVAAEIRALKKPEPYKGKGIKYADERIVRKSGKSGKDK